MSLETILNIFREEAKREELGSSKTGSEMNARWRRGGRVPMVGLSSFLVVVVSD